MQIYFKLKNANDLNETTVMRPLSAYSPTTTEVKSSSRGSLTGHNGILESSSEPT
jgi:hypothetical protein